MNEEGAHKVKVNLSWTPRSVNKTLKNSLTVFTNGTLPESIRIVVYPTKLKYKTNEKIDLSGIMVQLLDKDGKVWKSKDYPYGIIPVEELTPVPSEVTPSGGNSNNTNANEQE